MIRVALIGAGFIGRNHFDQYPKLGRRARVVAICDSDAARRRGDWSKGGGNIASTAGRVQDLHGVRGYARWQDVLTDPDVDMLDITLPTFLHTQVAVAALKAGKHVLCEKPMALTVRDCDRMIAAAKKAKRRFMVAQCIRFWPEYVWLRQACDQNRYGRLRALSLRRQAATPDWTWQLWSLDRAKSGGAILDLHVHDVDFALALLGRPKAVFARGGGRGRTVDRVHALWDCGRDRAVSLEGCWDMPPGFPFNMGFTALFEKAAVTWDLASGKPLTVYVPGCKPDVPTLPDTEGYLGEIEYFVSCIEKGVNPKVTTAKESRDAVAIALAEERSIRTGKPVRIG